MIYFPAIVGHVFGAMESATLADKLGWQVGERYLAFDEYSAQRDATRAASQIPIVISGIWAPLPFGTLPCSPRSLYKR